MSDDERAAVLGECSAYCEALRKHGHYIHGVALDAPRSATTLRFGSGDVSVTDGPFTETKEVLGGVMVLEAVDLNHAIQLMSQLPSMCARGGCVEIRPIPEQAIRPKEK